MDYQEPHYKYALYLAVDCEWGNWSYDQCSKTCGGGVQFITREKSRKASYGGMPCTGQSVTVLECNTDKCPGAKIFPKVLWYILKLYLALVNIDIS